MSQKKIIVVVGATGAQGGALVDAILADPASPFAVRALTRDPKSEKGRALAARGVEVVGADLTDQGSIERAFAGAHGAFCVTFFWAHFSAEKEQAEALHLARAAKAAGLKHVVWSTLEDTRQWLPLSDQRMPVLQGKYHVPHFDAKGEANRYFADAGVPTTYLNTAFYWENFIFFGLGPKRGPDGKLAITMPMGHAKLPGIAVADIGRAAYAIFKSGEPLVGKTIGIAGEHATGAQMAAAMGKALGEDVQYNEVSADVYRAFGFAGADEMGNMFQIKRDFETQYCANRPLDAARALVPSLLGFDTWLAQNAKRIPLQ
jgi:uncharacterized protein YbjT (DUF2867 family)